MAKRHTSKQSRGKRKAKPANVAVEQIVDTPLEADAAEFQTDLTEQDEEQQEKAEREPRQRHWLRRIGRATLTLVATLLVGVLLAVIGYFGYEYMHVDRVYAGVTIADHAFGGMNYTEAGRILSEYKDELEKTGLTFTYQDTTLTIPLYDEAVPLVEILSDDTLHEAFGVGRGTDSLQNIKNKMTALLTGQSVPVSAVIQTETVAQILAAKFDEYATPYENAQLLYADGNLTVAEHHDGTSFHWADVLAKIDEHVQNLEPLEFTLVLEPDPAPVTTALAKEALPQAEVLLALAPLTLTYADKTFTIGEEELASWLTLGTSSHTAQVSLAKDIIDVSLEPIAGELDIPVQEGRFSLDIVNGEVKLQQFQNGQDGSAVQIEETIAAIQQAVLKERQNTIPLVVAVEHPRATPDNISDLGIKELLGTGETNFSGSPTNRIGNIYKGAEMLNGLLIAPGETFSLLSILSPIDLEHDWLSELVIKGDKLEKEAGGGLCQIGTTSFRAAMMSGLPIVERRNHSWAVSYYNYNGKAGVDATIYEPSPDFRFKNDTEHYILWRSRIEGYDIYFELWGTADGRKGYFTEPVNYGHVSPGPTEEVVDPNLPPGTRDCVQHAYTGVSASFDYIVEWPDGRKDTENFTSVYRARPARCLIGPAAPVETTTDAAEQTEAAESTENVETTTDSTKNDSANTNSKKNKKDN